MKYEDEIEFLKNTMIHQSQIVMDLQRIILSHNNILLDAGNRLTKLEEKIKEFESEECETASDESGPPPLELKTPIQTSIPSNVPVVEVSYIS